MTQQANSDTPTTPAAALTKRPARSQNGSQNTTAAGRPVLLQILTEILGQLQDAGQQIKIAPATSDNFRGCAILLGDVELSQNGTLAVMTPPGGGSQNGSDSQNGSSQNGN